MEFITESEVKSLVGQPCRAPNGKLIEITAVNLIGEVFPIYKAVFKYLEEAPQGSIGMGYCAVDLLIPTTEKHHQLVETWRDRVNEDI